MPTYLDGKRVDIIQGSNYPDPWEELAGDEVFFDDFRTLSGWTAHTGFDTTTSPTLDTSADVFRAKSANPCVDSATRERGLIIMPAHTAGSGLSLSRDISSVLTASGAWTIMSKWTIPIHQVLADGSINTWFGLSLPASNLLVYNAVAMQGIEQDVAENAIQSIRYDNGVVGDITEWSTNGGPNFPSDLWLFLYHQNGAGTVNAFVSAGTGRVLREVGTITKDPATFTHLFLAASNTKQMVTEAQFGLDYVRVYQSLKQR